MLKITLKPNLLLYDNLVLEKTCRLEALEECSNFSEQLRVSLVITAQVVRPLQRLHCWLQLIAIDRLANTLQSVRKQQ